MCVCTRGYVCVDVCWRAVKESVECGQPLPLTPPLPIYPYPYPCPYPCPCPYLYLYLFPYLGRSSTVPPLGTQMVATSVSAVLSVR